MATLERRLERLGVRIVNEQSLNFPIHASGHPAAEELTSLYGWVQPEIAIPVHGEPAHMAQNADIAKRSGVPRQLVGSNGDLFMLAPQRGMRRAAAPVGRLGLDNRRLVEVTELST